MELREALAQISEIRLQMARTEVFRGYRSVPVAFSGVFTLVAAGLQSQWLPNPTANLPIYLALWVGVAVLSVVGCGVEMWWRSTHSTSPLAREVTWLAVEQFLPSVLAGALLTAVLPVVSPESAWMLPGLWQILYSLGIFASCRLLPRPAFSIAAFYLVTGTLCLVWANGDAALAPWAMGVPFGMGQLFAATVLYWTLERTDVAAQN